MLKIDKEILQEVQDNFPISKTPFKGLSKKFNLKEEELLSKIHKFRENGLIRRISPKIDVRKIEKRFSTLIAMKVPEERIQKVAEFINSYKEVSHNYERLAEYNLWFTLSSSSEKRVNEILDEIKNTTKINELLDLRVNKFFKLGVRFSLIKDKREKGTRKKKKKRNNKMHSINNLARKLLSLLQEGIDIVKNPFKSLSEKLRTSEDEIIYTLKKLKREMVIKSFGAILDSRKIGLKANAMIAWKVNGKREKIGEGIAGFEEITHCYGRRTYPEWQWNIYSVIHMKNKKECEEFTKKISKEIGINDYKIIYSTREFKNTGMRI